MPCRFPHDIARVRVCVEATCSGDSCSGDSASGRRRRPGGGPPRTPLRRPGMDMNDGDGQALVCDDQMLRRAAPGPRRPRPQRPGAASPPQQGRVPTHEGGPAGSPENGDRAVRVSVRVSNGLSADHRIAFLPVNIGAGERTRTADLLITNHIRGRPTTSGCVQTSFFLGNSRIPDPGASRNRIRVRSVGCQIGCQISRPAKRESRQ